MRHGTDRLQRNRNRRTANARVLDDPAWLRERYLTSSGVEIANELGVTARTVYAAMDRHGIARRTEPGVLKLRRPEFDDEDWLRSAVERGLSTAVAKELKVSAGTVTGVYGRAGIDACSTTQLYERGRSSPRPSKDQLRSAWEAEGSFRGVGRRLGVAHTTAAVWLAEVGVFADTTRSLSRSVLLDGVEQHWPVSRIAAEYRVGVTTVLIKLHRHGQFLAHRQRHRAKRVPGVCC